MPHVQSQVLQRLQDLWLFVGPGHSAAKRALIFEEGVAVSPPVYLRAAAPVSSMAHKDSLPLSAQSVQLSACS